MITNNKLLSSSHKLDTYVTCYVGQTRRDTIDKIKEANPQFPEIFHFVVSNKDQDSVIVKVKQKTSYGGKILGTFEIRVKSIFDAENMKSAVTEEIKKEILMEGATFTCDLKYRPTARVYNISANFL